VRLPFNKSEPGAVRQLLEGEVNVNEASDSIRGTTLNAAVLSRRKDMVQLLLKEGADVNIAGSSTGTALMEAAYGECKEIMQLLLENGADPHIVHGEYGTALNIAVHRGNTEIMQLLLRRGADPNICGGRYNHSALATAIHKYNQIMTNGPGIFAKNLRISKQLPAVVLSLLEAGADPNISYSVDWGKDCMNGTADLRWEGNTRLRENRKNTAKANLRKDNQRKSGVGAATYGSLRWSLLGVALHVCDLLARGGSSRSDDLAWMLLRRGAEFNTLEHNSDYLAAVQDLTKRKDGGELVSLIFQNGRDVNKMDSESWTLLGQAIFQKNYEMAALLLNEGADVNFGGGEYGSPASMVFALGSMEMVSLVLEMGGWETGDHAGTGLSWVALAGNTAVVEGMLDRDVDINSVDGEYGTALGAAASGGHKETVSMLLKRGASVMRVGGGYHTALGTYPTALDAAAGSGKTDDTSDLLTLLTKYATAKEQAPWPPFPMPCTGILEGVSSTPISGQGSSEALQTAAKHTVFLAGGVLTPDQARVACQDLGEEVLISLLGALVGLDGAARERFQSWIRNDIRYFVSHGFDFGLAYAAVRVAWNGLMIKDCSDGKVARHRYSWLKRAEHLDKARAMEISEDSTGQEIIKAPYAVMPRRVWDLKSNRVVAYSMLHAKTQAAYIVGNPAPTPVPTRPPFWAISHSWTDDIEAVDTPINEYQWPVPLPRNLNLEGVRKTLLDLGAEYVWLDVLCLRQHSRNPPLEQLKQEEWKLDVPTIGNIYRAAERVVRYFNGLGIDFTEHGWDSPRHWLRRAWTLQEIKTENTTYNGGVVRANFLNTQGIVSGKVTTLRHAIRPVLRLAAEVDSPSGCSVYELAREMAKRYATQPTDKVAGLLYLLRTSELPTYDDNITDEDAWRKCIPLLPLERKIELLFDFPYRGLLQGGWFPTWKQVLEWPERDPGLEHTRTMLQKDSIFKLAPIPETEVLPTEFICKVWAISNVFFQETGDPHDYEVKIADKVFGFYPAYLGQEPIGISHNQPFTLTVMSLGQSYNWVVCEHVRDWRQKEASALVDVVILRKVGVLRTDSCNELLLVRGEYKLKEIKSVFI